MIVKRSILQFKFNEESLKIIRVSLSYVLVKVNSKSGERSHFTTEILALKVCPFDAIRQWESIVSLSFILQSLKNVIN